MCYSFIYADQGLKFFYAQNAAKRMPQISIGCGVVGALGSV
jgi:hypothetical protein